MPVVWQEVLRHRDRPIGAAFAAARRLLEQAWGCHNLEVPMSAVCQGEGFAWFAGELLAGLPRFRAHHSALVAAYRRRQHIKSRNHPVPDLGSDGDWVEAPLWAWRAGQRRGRLFARQRGDRLELRSGTESWPM